MIGKYRIMTFGKNTIFIGALLCLSACGAGYNVKEPQQWQRANASQPVYQQGPKVDQMLNRDIGRCVAQLQEMKDLGLIKTAVEADSTGRVLGPDELRYLDHWREQREPLKNFIASEADFKTFNDCMEAKGWERIYAPGTSHVYTARSASTVSDNNDNDTTSRANKRGSTSKGFCRSYFGVLWNFGTLGLGCDEPH